MFMLFQPAVPSLTRRGFLFSAAAGRTAAQTALPGLHAAAKAGDTAAIERVLQQNPELVNLRDEAGLTALQCAVRAGQPDAITALVTHGAALNLGSPLLDAILYPEAAMALDMATTIAGNNAAVDIRHPNGQTALHLAAMRGDPDLCWLLVHRGARLERRNPHGQTPLQVATGGARDLLAQASSIEVVYNNMRHQPATEQRGFPARPAKADQAPLVNRFVTLSHNRTAEARALLQQHPWLLNMIATFDETAVEAAAHLGNLPWTLDLLERGAVCSMATAVALGEMALLKRLVGRNPRRLQERGPHDQPLLHYTAFGRQQLEAAAFLLDHGAAIEGRGLGQTALHFAARRGHCELAELLLDRGADVNAPSRSRLFPGTPLALALRLRQEAMARLLASRGGLA